MKPLSRKYDSAQSSARKFNRADRTTKALNLAGGGVRGGIRL